MHLEQRASGHADWIVASARAANRVLQWLDRADTLPQPVLPDWIGARRAPATPTPGSPVAVTLAEQLYQAMAEAKPGDTITVGPGTYRFSGRSLVAQRGGTPTAPITVRAETLGSVTLEFDLLEGFYVTAPYWRFENLTIRGVCGSHDGCEHAFHVVGDAHHVEIRNNVVSDFNAHIKVNGADGRFPDDGRIANNTLVDTAPRRTALPVTPIDLVGASRWSIEGNLIADFVKDGGDFTSYGAFAKGGGTGNAFVRNAVICERRLRGAPGRRVGLSLGGGGSDAAACRDRRCVVEHEDGLIAANLVSSCSDAGIYLNRAARSRVIHNTILDTAGVDVRFPESAALLEGNLIDGPIRQRDGALVDEDENATTAAWSLYLARHPVRSLFTDADALDLRFAEPPPRMTIATQVPDLCSGARASPAAMGAFEQFAACRRAGAQ
jgi:parallel beta-helix repeat protein